MVIGALLWRYSITQKIKDKENKKMLGLRKIIWALFGNDEDGIYGTPKWRIEKFGSDVAPSFKVAFWWWLRNPFHNFVCYILVWKRKNACVILEWNKSYTKWWFARQPILWQEQNGTNEFKQFTLQLAPFIISWRDIFGTEAYFGFRGGDGRFGIALRKYKSWAA